MTDEESFQSTLQEVKEIYMFLTEGEPSPDDEIEAKGKLIDHFNKLKNLGTTSEQMEIIDFILKDLEEWDTLDLWFSETSLPNDIKKMLKIPESAKISKDESPKDFEKPDIKPESAESEVDLTDIFNKASEQFKGEIENLKGKIDALKKEVEKKDESLKSMKKKRKVQKIIPKKNVKLAPPKIKIPVIKTLVKPPLTTRQPTPKTVVSKEQPKLKPVEANRVRERIEPTKENLLPIPISPKENASKAENQELTTPPEKVPKINTIVIEEPNDIPIITEKRKITPIITEEPSKATSPEFAKSTPFLTEKPKIASVRIEEIERESIVSRGSDLFNVFSSMGNKGSTKPQEISSSTKPQEISNSTKRQVVIEEKKREDKKKKKDEDFQESNVTPFINFNDVKDSAEPDFSTPSLDSPVISNDKDTLYQELIALEGKRYSLERNFKNLEKDYNKGSISELDFKNKNNNLKNQLNDITSRINRIRGLISTL
jgi:predicted transcriptional regulator